VTIHRAGVLVGSSTSSDERREKQTLPGDARNVHFGARGLLGTPGSASRGPAARRDGSVPSHGAVAVSPLRTPHVQVGATHHVLTPRSTFHSWIAAAAKAVPRQAADAVLPQGYGKGLRASLRDQM